MNLQEFFFARYDVETDTILNCKEGSVQWHHENRHRRQHKDGLLKKYQNFEMLMILTIMGLVFQDYFMARVCFIGWILYYSFFEVDAMLYSVYVISGFAKSSTITSEARDVHFSSGKNRKEAKRV